MSQLHLLAVVVAAGTVVSINLDQVDDMRWCYSSRYGYGVGCNRSGEGMYLQFVALGPFLFCALVSFMPLP